jgi:hypothetical protein
MTVKFKAFNNLLKELGRKDYVVEIVELAMREFLKRLKDSKNEESYLKKISEEHGIFGSFDSTNKYYHQITLDHISNV